MPTYNISSGLPAYPPGLTDQDAAKLVPLYQAINTLAQRISEVTNRVQYNAAELSSLDRFIGLTDDTASKVTIKAGEALTYGQLLTFTASGSDVIAMKADRTNVEKPAHGICNTPLGLALNAYGTALFMHGICRGVSGSVFGSQYWLSTAGAMQVTKPTGTGTRVQPVAIGLGASGIYLNIAALGDYTP